MTQLLSPVSVGTYVLKVSLTFRKDKPHAPSTRHMYNLILDGNIQWIYWSTPERQQCLVSGDYQKHWHIFLLNVLLPPTSEPKLFFGETILFPNDTILGLQEFMMLQIWAITFPYPFAFLGWFIHNQACNSNNPSNVFPEALRWSVLLPHHCQTGDIDLIMSIFEKESAFRKDSEEIEKEQLMMALRIWVIPCSNQFCW